MTVKQNVVKATKSGVTSRPERISANQQTELMLKEMKEKKGKMVLVAITNRTTIELPACLTQEERDARVANYLKLHNSKV